MTNPKQDSPSLDEVKAEDMERAYVLERMIANHQYGLRGFGDGSLSRGRDLTDAETRLIRLALRYLSEKSASHLSGDAQPVAWMHDGENRLNICHNTIKSLLIEAKCGKQVEHYTIPLYAHPAEKQASESSPAQGDAVMTKLIADAPHERIRFLLGSARELLARCAPHLKDVGKECCGNYVQGHPEEAPECCGEGIDLAGFIENELHTIDAALRSSTTKESGDDR